MASCIAKHFDRDKGGMCEAGNDVCFSCGGRDSGDIEFAIMRRFDVFSVWEGDANWVLRRCNVDGGGVGHEKMSGCSCIGDGGVLVEMYVIGCTCDVFCVSTSTITCFDGFIVLVYYCVRVRGFTTVCVGGSKF